MYTPVTATGRAYQAWDGAAVREALPTTRQPHSIGDVVVPTLNDWNQRRLTFRGDPTARLVIAWRDGGRSWEDPRDLVRVNADDQPVSGQPVKGLRCQILVPFDGTCANGGISSRTRWVTLVGDLVTEHDADRREPTSTAPAVHLRTLGGRVNAYDPDGTGVGPMASGSWIWDHSDEFRAISAAAGWTGPIPLHDRYETAAQYAALSTD